MTGAELWKAFEQSNNDETGHLVLSFCGSFAPGYQYVCKWTKDDGTVYTGATREDAIAAALGVTYEPEGCDDTALLDALERYMRTTECVGIEEVWDGVLLGTATVSCGDAGDEFVLVSEHRAVQGTDLRAALRKLKEE